jgi:hypothetical protein
MENGHVTFNCPLRRQEFIFLYYALMWFVCTLDAILELALPLRKLRENFVGTRGRIAHGNNPAEPDHISNRKPVVVGKCILLNFSHDRTCIAVIRSLPHVLQLTVRAYQLVVIINGKI